MNRRLFDSLMGGALPALIGVAATLLLTGFALHDPRVALLLVWTILGFLSLTDFGLTRAASKLATTQDVFAPLIVSRLWRSALPFGATGAVALGVIGTASGYGAYALPLLPIPLIAAMQFPLVGILEARGRFGYLAVHRLINALTSYLLPVLILILLPEQVVLAAALISLSRLILFLLICHRLKLNILATARGAFVREATVLPETRSVVSWLAVSSMLGPLLLYADRFALAVIDGVGEQWVYYVALSEILMKTYIIPTAFVAVLFPWLSTNVRSLTTPQRRLLRVWLPLASFLGATFVGIGCAFLLPDDLFLLLGAEERWVATARLVLAFCLSATLLNWVSQVHIAVLHALDAHRYVGLFQIASAIPFVAALLVAAELGGASAVAGVVFARVAATWIGLVARSRGALTHSPSI